MSSKYTVIVEVGENGSYTSTLQEGTGEIIGSSTTTTPENRPFDFGETEEGGGGWYISYHNIPNSKVSAQNRFMILNDMKDTLDDKDFEKEKKSFLGILKMMKTTKEGAEDNFFITWQKKINWKSKSSDQGYCLQWYYRYDPSPSREWSQRRSSESSGCGGGRGWRRRE